MMPFLRLLTVTTMFFATDAVFQPQGIVFLVDSSPKPDNGVTSWPSMVNFVYSVMDRINRFWCCPDRRFALIRYSDDAYLQFGFNWYADFPTTLLAVNGTVYKPGSGSNLKSALDLARTLVPTPNSRNDWNPWLVMVVVTDNLPFWASNDQLKTAVYKAKLSGLQIVMVGVGNNTSVDQSRLLETCSRIYRNNLALSVTSYSALQNYDSVVTTAGLAFFNTQLSGEPSTECYALYAEIVILLDSSTKDISSQFDTMRSFAQNVAFNFAYVSSNLVRFASVRYDTSPSIQFYLDWNIVFTDTPSNAIRQIQYSGGGRSNLSAALDLVRTDVFSSDVVRPGVPKIAIIITDNLRVPDNQTDDQMLLIAVNNLKATDVRVVAIGINVNEHVDLYLLNELGQNSDNYNNSFIVSDYSQLDIIFPAVMKTVCDLISQPDKTVSPPSSSISPSKGSEAVIVQQNPLLIAIVVIVAVISVILILIGILVICLTVYIVKDRENASPIPAAIQRTSKPIIGIDRRSIRLPKEDGDEHVYDSHYTDCDTPDCDTPDYEAPGDFSGK